MTKVPRMVARQHNQQTAEGMVAAGLSWCTDTPVSDHRCAFVSSRSTGCGFNILRSFRCHSDSNWPRSKIVYSHASVAIDCDDPPISDC
jgi:hypothetical protein